MLKKVCIFLLVFLPYASCLALSFPDQYDRDFDAATDRWLPGLDWRLLKAQCYQESALKPGAVSPVGAMGLCQFMPGTWSDVAGKLDFPAHMSAFAPELSIEAAAFYMAGLRRQWSSPRPEPDRHDLALASYNAGLGHLLTAQKRCNMAVLYHDIIDCLPLVTGHHSAETISYVDKIRRWWRLMVAGY